MNTTQTITIFTDLLTNQPDLFAQALPDLVELEQTVKTLADNQVAEIDNAIWSFCKKQTTVRDFIRLNIETQRGPGGQVPPPPTPADQLKEKLLILINALRVNSPHTPGNPPKPK